MKKFIIAAAFAAMTSPAFAQAAPPSVPEMDAGAGIAAIALLAGIAALIREKAKRK